LQWARSERIGETGYDLVVVSISAAGDGRDVVENLKHSPSAGPWSFGPGTKGSGQAIIYGSPDSYLDR